MAHYKQQQEPIITLHALDYIVKCDLTDEPIWNFATFNPERVLSHVSVITKQIMRIFCAVQYTHFRQMTTESSNIC